jgi:MFS family permease
VSWLAWSLTHAVSAVAVVTIAANAPAFVMTLIGASYADRYDRRRLMIGTDLARGVLVGIAALLLALGRLNFALLVAAAPMPVVLIIDALTFAVSAVTVAAIDLPRTAPEHSRSGLRADLGAGLAAFLILRTLSSGSAIRRSGHEARSGVVHVRAAVVALAPDRADVADPQRART